MSVGEPAGVGELLAIVDDVHAEAGIRGSAGQMQTDVPAAYHVEARCGSERIDVHIHLSTANEAVFLREVVVQLVVEHRRASRGKGVTRLPERIVLIAAAADGANSTAVGKDEHLRAAAL